MTVGAAPSIIVVVRPSRVVDTQVLLPGESESNRAVSWTPDFAPGAAPGESVSGRVVDTPVLLCGESVSGRVVDTPVLLPGESVSG